MRAWSEGSNPIINRKILRKVWKNRSARGMWEAVKKS